ncbi:MAG: CoB--CoM heterodisulfide reductase iron-sulfur subunit A family protein, partial [Proteobacteria bacterium]|nr:CoB--CoM heterodisulfide reductase iron-sulfur subunit A family protein [Pseudomonadota bacterium]
MSRVGVFVCHCGTNIAATVDVEKVAEEMKKQPGVVYTEDYKFMCSSPGQGKLKEIIEEHQLDSVVIAACSPHMHEKTFRNATEAAGLNAFKCEMANIREQCSWVHPDKAEGTVKSLELTKKMIEKVRRNEELVKIKMPVTKKALVIGGGIAGIQAALDIAASGTQVTIVEKEPSLGGHMAQLSETFPTLDCSQCIMTPKMVEASLDPNIKILTYAEVEGLDGFIGNFRVRIRKKAKSVIEEDCTGCGICQEKCPKKIPNPFEMNSGMTKSIAVPFPQAVPNVPVIDRDSCIYYDTGKCKVCQKFCGPNCIDFDQKDEIITEDVGAIVVATGYDTMSLDKFGEYGYGKYKDVIDGLTFERMASASGPTGGEMQRPSDGKTPETVVFVHCAGSRD